MHLNLEDFSAPPVEVHVAPSGINIEDVEAAKTEAYEKGYSAGFDDAVKVEQDNQTRIGEEFASHLRDMSFTFHEARAHMLEAILPLLQELVTTFLPKQMQKTLGVKIVETLQPLMEQAADQPIVVAVAPGSAEVLSPLMDESILSVLRLEEETTLTEGQAFIRLGQVERKIDLDSALSQFRDSLDALAELNGKALKNE